MFRVALVNPPFANVSAPSFALTQLRELVRRTYPGEVDVSLHYLNIDFARHVGLELYNFIAGSMDALNSGVGEWMFRAAAFPGAPDNATEYFRRYRHHLRRADGSSWWPQILEARTGAPALLEELIDRHALDRADLVGFSSMFSQNAASFALARLLKARQPRLVTVIGGANCESPMGNAIAAHADAIDYVFSGPALVSFPQFIDACRAGDQARCGEIEGVIPAARLAPRPAGTALRVIGAAKPAIGPQRDIDRPIDLDYSDFLDRVSDAFGGQVSPILFFETSRGCWWGEKAHCTFCGLNGQSMTYRWMKPELAIDQFQSLFRYADRAVELQCVDNIMPRSYLTDVLPLLDTPADTRIFYEVKADLGDEEMRTLAKARVTRIQPGIESLATSTLKLMRKGTTAYQNIQFLKHCATHGVEPSWNLLVGFPGEREDVYRKYVADVPSLVHLPPPSGVFPVRFDRFSPYFVRADEYGLKLQPLEFYELAYPFPPQALERMAYFFADDNPCADYAITVGTWIGRLREVVGAWRDGWRASRPGGPPSLHFESAGSPLVVDTRSGEGVTHDVGSAGAAVLRALSKPRRREDVVRELAGCDADEVAAALDMAVARRLVFEEDGRFVSLVLSPAARSVRMGSLAGRAPAAQAVCT